MRKNIAEQIHRQFLKYLDSSLGNGHLIGPIEGANYLSIKRENLNLACKIETGLNTRKIIIEKTIQKAYVLYKETSYNEKEIAGKLGYVDLSSFCHFFDKHTGTTLKLYAQDKDEVN